MKKKQQSASIRSTAKHLFIALSFFASAVSAQQRDGDWCSRPLRSELSKLKEIKTSRPWFKVYDVGHKVYAIDEPYNYEETIAYLIIGNKRALLFDTGMGMDSISLVVKQLTRLPVTVLNSHTHPDHIGGNHEFNNVLAMNTAYTRMNARNGYSHDKVRDEVTPGAFCQERLPGLDTAKYYVRPFKVSKYIDAGYKIELGGREIQVIATPGHTPDAIGLWDASVRYLWTGDSFYQGPIFLFDNGTNLDDYGKSMNKLAQYAANARSVMPAHNIPGVAPAEVIAAAKAFREIMSGRKKGLAGNDNTITYGFGNFSYRIGRKYLMGALKN